MEKIIEVKEASFQYPDATTEAVKAFSMDVYKGEFLAVLGHNGSGKSTMAKLLNALLVATIVEEDVAFGLENLGVPTAEIRRRVDEALDMVGMSEYAGRAPHMLSGGQKQRVAIAGVLAMRPDVIVFDEATAMLDPSGRKDVLGVVRRLNKEEGVTVIWITHFMEEAAIADRIVVMADGEKRMEGTPKEVFGRVAEIKALGLDVPPMAELSGLLRADGLKLPEGILTVDEMVVALCLLK